MVLFGMAAAACTGGRCDAGERQDETSLLVLGSQRAARDSHLSSARRRRKMPPGYTIACSKYTGPPSPFYGVCVDGSPESRCDYVLPFQLSGNGLPLGLGAQAACVEKETNTSGDPNVCFQPPKVLTFFQQYAQGYAKVGMHAAFVFSSSSCGTTGTYSRQSNRKIIKEFYGSFVAENAVNFSYTAFPETVNATYVQDHNSCMVRPSRKRPAGFEVFFFTTATFAYAGGIAVLGPDGKIVRQYAFVDGPPQKEGVPGYVQNTPTRVRGKGKAIRAYRGFFKAFFAGNAKKAALYFTSDAKIVIFKAGDDAQSRLNPEFGGINGRRDITRFLKKNIKNLGKEALENRTSLLQTVEEASGKVVPGNSQSAFIVGANNLGFSFVFEGSKIYGGVLLGLKL